MRPRRFSPPMLHLKRCIWALTSTPLSVLLDLGRILLLDALFYSLGIH